MARTDYRTIVVGTDGSPLAGPTVSRAAWIAHHDDADLVIVCAYSRLSRRQEARNVTTGGGDARVGQVLGRRAASDALDEALRSGRAQGATVTAALLVEAEPGAALLQAASTHAAELIVVGAIRDVSVADRLLGTVATDVVRRAVCDVLVVRPEAPGGDQVVPESDA